MDDFMNGIDELSLAYRQFDSLPTEFAQDPRIAIVRKLDLTETSIKYVLNFI